ncbi:maltose alpha-D-glucosyltransferase [Tellurirhabdus rosea]|uniref:maltose alpha-D-glucosyltransferase n=1 Tax=Tellurirhabdus rosea TaxID=2674997 RepID=UPI002250670B|nr:maltose alpha-D-glucosyltransferase [Tellurirhabdus rosea]
MERANTELDDQLHWYKDAIIYELHIKAFRDSNGDGIGDFQGLLEKLDYLQELGVTAVWVLPFYPSPLKDDGYDIADYYSINPSYGTIEQFQEFLREAHNRNLKVITELVINHTSDQHPWFQRARRAPKGSPERDFYVWTDNPSQWKDVRIIFQDFEASNWTWDPVAEQYYWHRFFYHQPDLNYDNPLVQEEIFRIIDYWCAMGVDGFRLDAVPYLYEREGTNGENLPETHAYLKKLRAHVDEKFPGTVFLAEANMWPEDSASYFANGDECHMNYHFPVMPRMFMAVQMEDRYPITDIFDQTPDIPETCQWAIFLRNHDELTLEMVTDEERDYMYKMYARNPKARINLGIRHRLAPLMDNDRRKIELLNSLLFSLRGTPVLYYGDEIGMGDNVYLGDRDGVRTPMQWSPDRNAGFSGTNPQKLYLPVILDPQYHYESVNVEVQRQNTSSLWWFTRRMITMRKRYKAFGRGDLRFLNAENPKVLAYTRCYRDETLLIVVNLSKYSQAAEIDLEEFKGYIPVEAFSKNRFPLIRQGQPYVMTLGPYDYQWFVLEKAHSDADTQMQVPVVQATRWEDLTEGTLRAGLETRILPAYLARMPWFMGGQKTVNDMTIAEVVPIALADRPAFQLLVEVAYERGLPELYQLPVVFVGESQGDQLTENCPQAVIARLQMGEETGLLVDGLYVPDFQRTLFDQLVNNQRITTRTGSLFFSGSQTMAQYLAENPTVRTRIHTSEPGYTSLALDSAFVLKLFRKVERGVQPELEISRALTWERSFEQVPTLVGTVELRLDKDNLVLGVVEEYVENHGDSYGYLYERVNNYIERILARDPLPAYEKRGTLTRPVGYDELPDDLQDLLGGPAAEHAQLIGRRTGEMHLALAAVDNRDFRPEEFSLHYQRSLYAGMQSLVREAFQRRDLSAVTDSMRSDLALLMTRKAEIQESLKRIYAKKLDAVKIRIHGNYHLGQLLQTGKDVIIRDFGGEPARPYSERRIRRSPLRDVVGIIRSIYYVAYDAFSQTVQTTPERIPEILPMARLWTHYMTGFFLKAYYETVADSLFLPSDEEDLRVMLETYLLENALDDLRKELTTQPERALVPMMVVNKIV